MRTALLLDDLYTRHDTGRGHPETAGRIQAISERFHKDDLTTFTHPLTAREVTDDEVLLCHTPAYLKTVLAEIDGKSSGMLSTGDTVFSPDSLEVARKAAGGLLVAVDAVMKGERDNAFCVVRPPGHHATPSKGMGFCIFNSVAIAARYAQKTHGVERVAIVDWDVHHGNGTQDIFYEDGSVFFFSTHQHPWYPGTGMAGETGEGAGKKTTMNFPLPAGTGMADIGAAFRKGLAPAMKDYKPDLILISAGFDSRVDDPLGQFLLRDADFAELTRIVRDLAEEYADGRLVSVLEGGYNLSGLPLAAAAHLKELMA